MDGWMESIKYHSVSSSDKKNHIIPNFWRCTSRRRGTRSRRDIRMTKIKKEKRKDEKTKRENKKTRRGGSKGGGEKEVCHGDTEHVLIMCLMPVSSAALWWTKKRQKVTFKGETCV